MIMLYFWRILLIIALPLSGCQNSPSPEYRSCFAPTTTIIHELSRQSFFDENSSCEIARLEIESLKEHAEKDEKEALLTVQIVFSALRNSTEPKVSGTYFIAVTDREENPLIKKNFPLEIVFEGKKKHHREIKVVTLPLPLDMIHHCQKYQAFIGLDLKGSELEHTLRPFKKKSS